MGAIFSLTGMRAMFRSSESSHLRIRTWLPSWVRERILGGIWWLVPLALVISLAGGLRFWFFRTIVAMFALASLRLLDDLEDVGHDRLWHPERALCKTSSLSQAYGFCVAGLTISCFLLASVGSLWISFVTVLLVVFGASRFRRKRTDVELRVIFAQIILLKVPALVIALGQGEVMLGKLCGRAVALFGFVGAYEVIHDEAARRSSWARIVLVFDMVCLVLGLATWIIEETGT
jgi:hypothetical protein